MKLRPRVSPRPLLLPATTAADLAFLLFVLVVAAGVFSAARGMALGFVAPREAASLPPPDTPTVWVEVRADESILLDGAPIPRGLAVDAVRARLAPHPEAVIVVHAEPLAPYGALAELLAEMLEREEDLDLGPRRIAVPTLRQVEARIRATGTNPFEVIR